MISLVVNDKVVKTHVAPSLPLVDFLRLNNRLLGTKIGCREGDCGACTVLIGEVIDGKLVYKTVTSCLMPVANVNGKHVVTIEGVNPMEGLNPIAEAFRYHGGTQCGFCTPGFIMGLYGFALGNTDMTYYNAIASVDGNICRCTGYKSITNAIKDIVSGLSKRDSKDPIKWLVKNNYIPEYFASVQSKVDSLAIEPITGGESDLVVGGGTDLYVEEFDEVTLSESIIPVADRKDLKGIKLNGDEIVIGAATTVEELRHNDVMKKFFPDLERQTRLVSSSHIRNMATIGGNIVNAAPIGDLTVSFMALGATLKLTKGGNTREVQLKDFFVGYKKADIEKGEILETISFKAPSKSRLFSFEKVSKRTYLDIAVVNSSLVVELDGDTIKEASWTTGGVGPMVRFLDKSCEFLKGQKISDETFRKANEIAQTEITPRSRANYKRLLLKTQLFNHLSRIAPDKITLEALA